MINVHVEEHCGQLMGKVEKSCLKRFQVSRIKIVAAASHAAPDQMEWFCRGVIRITTIRR